jgi:hypothetical protein
MRPRKAHHSYLLLTRGAPGNGDRASTSRYPLVSALSPVVGAPLGAQVRTLSRIYTLHTADWCASLTWANAYVIKSACPYRAPG